MTPDGFNHSRGLHCSRNVMAKLNCPIDESSLLRGSNVRLCQNTAAPGRSVGSFKTGTASCISEDSDKTKNQDLVHLVGLDM